MRMEDLDAPRVIAGTADAILRDLEWLGLDWDGPVVLQSTGLERVNDAVRRLIERGLAYACVCTRGDLRTAQSAPQAGTLEPRYPGTCRGRFASIEAAERSSGKPAGLRFVARDGETCFVDGFAGPVVANVADDAGDFLIARKGGAPAYQLAVVVDDAAQGVTEVVRGDDLLASTARQSLLQEALGLPHPSWWHVPLVVDETGRRLAKRDDDLSLAELRERGVAPEAIVGWVVRESGLAPVERISARDALPVFDLARVSKAPLVARRDRMVGALGATAR